jgi:hypothetical protein
MIEHEQLLEFAKDEDDYPVMLYVAEIGKVIDWKQNSPSEVLYVPEEIFQAVARSFIDNIGLDGYYNKIILDKSHIEYLCGDREPSDYSERYKVTLEVIREFVNAGLLKTSSHYLAFEGP